MGDFVIRLVATTAGILTGLWLLGSTIISTNDLKRFQDIETQCEQVE